MATFQTGEPLSDLNPGQIGAFGKRRDALRFIFWHRHQIIAEVEVSPPQEKTMGLTQRELCPSQAVDDNRWYAVVVKYQHERTVQAALAFKAFSSLVPLYKVRNRWSDRFKEVELPLFAGYVFCRFGHGQHTSVLSTPGVRSIVGFGGEPAPVDAAEIDAIQRVVDSNLPVGPWPHLKPGDRVRVERGPLRGLEGTLIREKDRFRLVIGIELLQRSIATELGPEMISPHFR